MSIKGLRFKISKNEWSNLYENKKKSRDIRALLLIVHIAGIGILCCVLPYSVFIYILL